jgi:uncharacterized membrane protein YphA (DoxX/SURF4 family)
MSRSQAIRVAKVIGTWAPAILLVVVFGRQGWAKFSDSSGWATAFRHWGYPVWFRQTIGVVEVLAAALLLSGRWAAWGAALIVCVMLGGMGTHIAFDHGRHISSEATPLILAIVVLIIRRRQLDTVTRTAPLRWRRFTRER